jgi:hypothetical protein
MGKSWSDAAIRKLVDWKACPRCDYTHLTGGWCPNCGADLNGPQAVALATASRAAVEALELRQGALDMLPITKQPVSALAAGSTSARTVAAPMTPPLAAERPSSQISVQSVLAVAGAGLVAIAAIVFTFFNPDLADPITRNAIVAATTIVFLGAAWLLARVGLQFSAEAVGALGMVFVLLDIWAIATGAHSSLSDYGIAAIATLVVSGVVIGLASIRRMRTWLWSGLVGVAVTPALVGFADGRPWIVVLGFLGVGLAALLTHEIARRLQARFDSPLLADHGTATLGQFLVLITVVVQLPLLSAANDMLRFVGVAAIIAGLALMSALATRNGAALAWSYLAGALLTAAVALLPFAHNFSDGAWLLAAVPGATAASAAILMVSSRVAPEREKAALDRTALTAGTLTVVLACAVPSTVVALGQLVIPQPNDTPIVVGLAAMLGVAAAALGCAVAGWSRRHLLLIVAALWLGVLALAAFATWGQLSSPVRVATALALSIALAAIASRVRLVAAAPIQVRLPLLVGAHGLIVLAAVMSLADDLTRIYGGIGVVVAIAVLITVVPREARPFYLAIGYGFALSDFAFTLSSQTVLSDFAVLGLTTVLAALVAIAVTLLKSVPVPYWFSVLAVTAIPFLISIFSMLIEVSGWTGLSTAVVFLLAATLVLVQRSGLGVLLRGLAAGMLLPALAVVVIDVVAQFATVSASPITLPITAGLVAVTLPSTGAVGSILLRLGHTEPHANVVKLWLEISALVTGAIAVGLTVVRTAAGFDTTFLVLVIIGLGAAATGQFLRRRYAWIVAAISFTGALWSLLALNAVDSIELYIMPPALAAAIIGAVGVSRGRRGLAFYAFGLAIAVVTPLGLLALRGNPGGSVFEWRTLGLLAGAVLLIVVGGLLGRIGESSRFYALSQLQAATLFVAMGAASAGAVQAFRYGRSWDTSVLGHSEAVLLPVLAYSVGSVLLAGFAAVLLAEENPRLAISRWLYVPAMVLLVAGPIASLRHGWAYPVTMLVLAAALLALMIVTAVVGRSTRTITLPPVWVTFAVAWFTAVAGWAERDHFRVEAYSIPLGFALLAAGMIAMRPVKDAAPTFTSWPIGHEGSWRLLAPGILVTLLPSVLATATDPRTERAILVIALALVAILIGNLRKLAAPFILGIIVLPVENIIVFAVRVGEKIDAATWWITLATAGAVLLVLAVSSERGSTGDRGVAARLRDLN